MYVYLEGMGYVSVDNIGAVGPVPEFVLEASTDGTGRFAIAAFHQLHCLVLKIS